MGLAEVVERQLIRGRVAQFVLDELEAIVGLVDDLGPRSSPDPDSLLVPDKAWRTVTLAGVGPNGVVEFS